jgi:Na+-translocating ferredoxin:NAD+ oxidoreductase subunit D
MDENKQPISNKQLIISSSPHILSHETISRIMWSVVIALLPALIGSVYFFGFRMLLIIGLSVLSAVSFEALSQMMWHKKVTINDGSAVITGILVAFNLPPNIPILIPIIGSAFAIVIVKQIFGGLGYNFINPALSARAFLMISWPQLMTTNWLAPRYGYLAGYDAITQATPLTLIKNFGSQQIFQQINSWSVIKNLIIGNRGGCIGETSVILLLCGAVYLIIKGYIRFRIPLAYISTVLISSFILFIIGISQVSPIFHLFAGGLILGSFFMATDPVTSPISNKGQWIFGIGCGIITILIRIWGGYPEGVSYSILLMNVVTPLIDRYTKPKVFGYK